MKIVDLKDIPVATDTPLNNLMELFSVCQRMEKLCIESKGLGLSAVQVGIPWKLFVYWDNYPNKPYDFKYIVNAEYDSVGDSKSNSLESCLSIKNEDGILKYFKLKRFDNIKVNGKILIHDGDKPFLENFEKFLEGDVLCVVFQHEIDHQRGKLISDLGEEILLTKF